DAKGRAEAYNQAAEMIQDGVLEYYAQNPAPSPAEFTPNGLTLVKKVASAINLVNDTINGHLPSQRDMQHAVEPMTPQGNEPQNPSESPVNEPVQTAGPAPIRKVAPIVIERTVPPSQGLQPDEVAVITATTGKIIRSMTVEEAQAAVTSLTGNQTPDPGAKTTLFNMNTDTKITAERAVRIQAAVQAAKK